MSVRSILIVVTCVLLAAGCRRDPRLQVYIDNVNAEKRMLEDTLYDLQYDYECKLREVEQLQSELARVKGTTSDTGAAKSGSSRLKSPAASGNRLFPDLSDLEPPTVDQGTPDTDRQRPKTESGGGAKPGTERPKPPAQDDVDDLEPPTLELPDEPADSPQPKAADAKQGSAPTALNVTQRDVDPALTAGEQTEEQLSGSRALEPSQSISGKPDSKLEDRWTPRSARRPDPPKRSIRLADVPSPGTATGSAQPAGTGSLSDGAATPDAGGATDARQANRPAWRPYR
jgi:hypothetical protein